MTQFKQLQSGFSITEVIAAMVIFALASTASLSIFSSTLGATRGAVEIEESTTLAVEEIERQRSKLLPADVANEIINDYTRSVTVNGCNFIGTSMACLAANCNNNFPACLITVTVTNNLTGDVETLTSIKLTEQL